MFRFAFRGRVDVLRFTLFELRVVRRLALVVAAAFGAIAILLWWRDVEAGAWLAAVIASGGFVRGSVLPAIRWFARPPITDAPDPEYVRAVQSLTLDPADRAGGFITVQAPTVDPQEWVVRSPTLDRWLRRHDVPLEEAQHLAETVKEQLRANAGFYERVLRVRLHEAEANARLLWNEPKTCLGADTFRDGGPVPVYRASYFHSLLTNELVARRIAPRGGRTAPLHVGSSWFRSGTRTVLRPMHASGMTNHIGVSTVAVTRDLRLVLWRQSDRAQQSRNRLAPTGSGSCDWSDFTGLGAAERTLKQLVVTAMERELREESRLEGKLASVPVESRVLGYARDLRRGGMPDFFGVSRVDVPSRLFRPDGVEVEMPLDDVESYSAASVGELRRSIATIHSMQQDLSMPLWLSLVCLSEALDESPAEWAGFLRIPH